MDVHTVLDEYQFTSGKNDLQGGALAGDSRDLQKLQSTNGQRIPKSFAFTIYTCSLITNVRASQTEEHAIKQLYR
jgi:hypothetical protein